MDNRTYDIKTGENRMSKFEKLSRDDEKKTKIIVGHNQFTIDQLEREIKIGSEIGKKLDSVEKKLEKQT